MEEWNQGVGNLGRALISFFRALMFGYIEKGFRLFSVVHSKRTRGSSHALKQRKFCQLIREETSP